MHILSVQDSLWCFHPTTMEERNHNCGHTRDERNSRKGRAKRRALVRRVSKSSPVLEDSCPGAGVVSFLQWDLCTKDENSTIHVRTGTKGTANNFQ